MEVTNNKRKNSLDSRGMMAITSHFKTLNNEWLLRETKQSLNNALVQHTRHKEREQTLEFRIAKVKKIY